LRHRHRHVLRAGGEEGAALRPGEGLHADLDGRHLRLLRVLERVGRDIAAVLAKPEVKEAFGKLAFETRSSSPQELSAFVVEQLEAYRRAARQMNLSLD
jgi:hypothetical protein